MTKDRFFQIAEKIEVEKSYAQKLWPLLQPILPELYDHQSSDWCDGWVHKLLKTKCGIEEKKQVFEIAKPLCDLCPHMSDKLNILVVIFNLPTFLRKSVVEVAMHVFYIDTKQGNEIGIEITDLCSRTEQELKAWLDKHGAARRAIDKTVRECGIFRWEDSKNMIIAYSVSAAIGSSRT